MQRIFSVFLRNQTKLITVVQQCEHRTIVLPKFNPIRLNTVKRFNKLQIQI